MYTFVLVVHILVSFFLIIVILLQGGRGGLGEALGGAGAQTLFGGGANIVMTKLTAVVATVFMVTCLSLAALSTARGRSVIERYPTSGSPLPLGLPGEAVPAAPAPAAEPMVPSPALDQPVTPEAPPPPTEAAPAPAEPAPAAPAPSEAAP